MFEWKVEDMALLNESGRIFLGKEKIYICESTVPREDKIAFVDSLQDGKLSYILSLIEKFKKERESLPKDKWNNVKTVSLKAWIKKNDTKYAMSIIDDCHHYGKFCILGTERWITNDHRGRYDTYDDLVDEVFHRQLKKCEKKENEYFLEHDEYSILKEKLRNKRYDTTFGVNISFWGNGKICIYDENNNERDITIDELKYLLSKYEELDEFVRKITEETHIKF